VADALIADDTHPHLRSGRRRGELPAELVLGVMVVLAFSRGLLARVIDGPAVQAWFTVFVSISIQALPFLVLGVVLSGAIAAFVPADALTRALPRRPVVAVPVAALAGAALPGCECGSVPIAGRLVARGATPAAALTFLLAAPAINPVVIVATAVAFPGRPEMAVARFVASLLTAVVVGLVWVRFGRPEWVDRARRRNVDGATRWATFTATAAHDFVHAGGFLVIGGLTAATLQVVVARSALDNLAGSDLVAVVTMASLAVVLAICSEADAFVAAGLSQFSLTSRLVFLVVGPMVDVKLVALQAGVFGRAFASRFAPLTLVTAIGCAALVGTWMF
jgi:uncharacterized membrane protein YraQ (UPF0718 family)